jgi:pimeloyl-ACP methyl ester carboxylesterase
MTAQHGETTEFDLLEENATEAGLDWHGPPVVERVTWELSDGGSVSAIKWGDTSPESVFLHGGAQNAHTWDTVILAVGRPALAIDLPGHGHSTWRADRDYWPHRNAATLARVIASLAPEAGVLVGMSLGGLTAIRLAATRPDLVRALAIVDVTPGVTLAKSAPIAEFVNGPETFESFEAVLERTIRYHPNRSHSSLRRGVAHNTRPLSDGRWAWRYDRLRPPTDNIGFGLWDDLAKVTAPILLVVGSESGVVSAADIAKFQQLRPDAVVAFVECAGHSVQGDQPIALANLIADFAAR